jgi:hypothetical protein
MFPFRWIDSMDHFWLHVLPPHPISKCHALPPPKTPIPGWHEDTLVGFTMPPSLRSECHLPN